MFADHGWTKKKEIKKVNGVGYKFLAAQLKMYMHFTQNNIVKSCRVNILIHMTKVVAQLQINPNQVCSHQTADGAEAGIGLSNVRLA